MMLPTPRFVDNSNGTVTDSLTGLVWLKNANCTAFFNGDSRGANNRPWADALSAVYQLADGYCDLSDNSAAGNWRLPTIRELQSLLDYRYGHPTLSNAAGDGQWTEGDTFSYVQNCYWSSTSSIDRPDLAWGIDFYSNIA